MGQRILRSWSIVECPNQDSFTYINVISSGMIQKSGVPEEKKSPVFGKRTDKLSHTVVFKPSRRNPYFKAKRLIKISGDMFVVSVVWRSPGDLMWLIWYRK